MTGRVKLVIIATILAIQVLMLGMTVSTVQAQGTNWAILISGGGNIGNNHARYWNDISEMNEILTDIYGYNPANIFVLYADGNPPSAANCHDSWNADASYPTNTIDHSATRANIQAVCNHISTNGDPEDTLFVFSTDHGNIDGAGGALLILWGQTVSANNFATDIGVITQFSWRAFEMEQCYSGGFVGPLSGPRTVIATACASTELSYAIWPPPPYYDEFCYYFNAALKGELPDGTIVNADADGDGRVSFMEAFNYAETNDTAPETPQYDDNADGTSHTGQMPLSGDGCLGSMVFLGEPHTAIDHGLVWLCNNQNSNGSWSNSVGMTSLGSLVFLNSGASESHFTVQDAIGYITSYVQPDGSISIGYPYSTYETSLSVMALVATHNPSHTATINNAANWLKDSQWDESCLWGSVNMDNWHYGGFGYGSHTRPDLSNTQFALMALDSVTSISKGDLLWDKAQVFLARDQMRQQDVSIPDLAYTVTWDPSYNIYNDGGFVYFPGTSLSTTGTSYGSMTAAGIWGLRLCDVPPSDPRTVAALNWLLSNYTWDNNPGMTPDGRRFQYYYYLGLSKALTMTLPTEFFDGHDWYADMSAKLLALQHPDGHWINTYTGHGGEGDPALCTSYSVLSLQVREIPAPISRLSWLTFILNSNADLHVYDPEGRHVGMNYASGQIEIQIPGATFTHNGAQVIEIPSWITAGKYVAQLFGTGNGEYELTIQGGYQAEVLVDETINGFIVKDAVHAVLTTAAMVVGLNLDVAIFDEAPPDIYIEVPQQDQALQDGVTLTAAASDQSGVASLSLYIREPGGTPIGLENLPATFNGATSRWEYLFDTTQLLDGYYEILARAVDNKGYEGWSVVVPFSIRNWAIVELLPSSKTNKAGRTMPVKFSLRVAEVVDPAMPFVYNEELEIRIYDTADPGNILQQSTFGSASRDYRINSVTELYITNFRSMKTPATYKVEIWRLAKGFMIDSFTFETVK